ncbi:MAG: M56 family metallopeptidase [Bacteroidaceae bacterium]|nr:M56 family metallopeptidase [Bacteroidaceae bacterium]
MTTMNELLLYTIKSAFVLGILYVPYTLLLRKEDFFRFNRLTLLGILALSIGLPLCNIPALSADNQPVVHAAQLQMIEIGIPIMQMADETDGPSHTSSPTWFQVASLIFLLGMMTVLCLRLIQMGKMGSEIRKGSLWHSVEDGVDIHCHAGAVAPYSWLHHIVISLEDYEKNGHEIILHEKGHIHNLHSFDILLLTLVEMLQWWNPLVYMLGMSLRDVHEYEADDYVLHQGVSLRDYQNLLIRKAVGASSYTFANNFNHSLTKKRITMMCKKKSNPWMRSKALYAVPMVAIALSAFATPAFVNPIEKDMESGGTSSLTEGKVTNNFPIGQTDQQKKKGTAKMKGDKVLDTCDKLPEFEGGQEQLMKLLQANVRYPETAQSMGVQGRIVVEFIVEKDGSVSDVKVCKKDITPSLESATVITYADEEDKPKPTEEELRKATKALEEETIRVARLTSGKWTPGEQDGQKVRVKFSLPLTFRLN